MWASNDCKARRMDGGIYCRAQCWKTLKLTLILALLRFLDVPVATGWVYPCNVPGQHRSPSLLLVLGLEITGSWYLSPLEHLSLK